MIKFTTINVDGSEITREFNTIEEIKKDWYSDDCTLPANDDEVIYAEIDGMQLHYPTIFEELLDELGIKEESNMSEFKYDFNVHEKEILAAIKRHECYDSWGEAQYGNDKQGVDYNICIDNTTEETEYCSAFYKIYADEDGVWQHDDCCEYYSYEIDFKDKDWKKKLEEATKRAYAELFE